MFFLLICMQSFTKARAVVTLTRVLWIPSTGESWLRLLWARFWCHSVFCHLRIITSENYGIPLPYMILYSLARASVTYSAAYDKLCFIVCRKRLHQARGWVSLTRQPQRQIWWFLRYFLQNKSGCLQGKVWFRQTLQRVWVHRLVKNYLQDFQQAGRSR